MPDPNLPMFTFAVNTFSNQTLRQEITLSRGGSELRVRFTNEYGTTPVNIGAASVTYRAPSTGKMLRLPLTFGGSRSATVTAGAPAVSDAVALAMPDGARLEISIYFPDRTPVSTIHMLALQKSYLSGPGDFTLADTLPDAKPFEWTDMASGKQFFARAFLSEVDVAGDTGVKTIVAFGDSITDGFGATLDMDRRWPDFLARRIVKAHLPLAIINQGIGGNQVLRDMAGMNALARFDRDALAIPGVSTVILLEGINDIGLAGGFMLMSRPDIPSADEIIQGYRQLIARAHGRGLRIIGATLTPFAGADYYTSQKESVRLAVNDWIRTGGAFDSMVDFDKALRDPTQPNRLKAEHDSGDHLHPNDVGYEIMANTVDLSKL